MYGAVGQIGPDRFWRFIAGPARVADAPARQVRSMENCIVEMVAESWCVYEVYSRN